MTASVNEGISYGAALPKPAPHGRDVYISKRGYEEFVFDSHSTAINSSNLKERPRRRGPLARATCDNIEKVKAGGGACWRCKMLKKAVSGLLQNGNIS